MRLFDRYAMVDWSAASRPTTGKDSIWVGLARPGHATRVTNIPTRLRARAYLHALAAETIRAGERLLIGVDFPFGYPRGVAKHVTGHAKALTLWRWIAARLKDGSDNANNRYDLAEQINRLYPGTGPFWGRPAAWDHPDIPTTEKARTRTGHPPERRLADTRAKGAKTVWQLAYAGSVGSQVLTGLPALLHLRDDPELAPHTRIWPLETGLAAPTHPVTIAEIYPSLLPPDPSEAIKDAGQVRAVADWLAGLDRDRALGPLFAGPADATARDRSVIVAEEAWILGLDAPAVRIVDPAPKSLGTAPVPTPGSASGPTSVPTSGPTFGSTSVPTSGSTSTPTSGPAAEPAFESADDTSAAMAASKPGGRARAYLKDPAEIYRRSFAIVRDEARLDHLPKDLHDVAIRLVHACGMPEITARLAWSDDVATSAAAALRDGAPILCDAEAVAAMVIRTRLPAVNRVICTLNEEATPELARAQDTTRSAAAVDLWRPDLANAIVAIGNAPTALFHLLDRLAEGWPKPAAILGFPVGFVGAAESKAELAQSAPVPFLTLRGRRGGSAMAAAAVNALARP